MKIDNYKIPERATTIQLFDTSDDFIPTEVEIENLFSEYNTVRSSIYSSSNLCVHCSGHALVCSSHAAAIKLNTERCAFTPTTTFCSVDILCASSWLSLVPRGRVGLARAAFAIAGQWR